MKNFFGVESMTYSIKAQKKAITAHFTATKQTLDTKKKNLVNKGLTIVSVKRL